MSSNRYPVVSFRLDLEREDHRAVWKWLQHWRSQQKEGAKRGETYSYTDLIAPLLAAHVLEGKDVRLPAEITPDAYDDIMATLGFIREKLESGVFTVAGAKPSTKRKTQGDITIPEAAARAVGSFLSSNRLVLPDDDD